MRIAGGIAFTFGALMGALAYAKLGPDGVVFAIAGWWVPMLLPRPRWSR